MSDESRLRARAAACELRAQFAVEDALRTEWSDIAMEWHYLAATAADRAQIERQESGADQERSKTRK